MKFSAGAEREIPPMCRNTLAKKIFHCEAISLVRRTNYIKNATDKSVAFLVEEGGFEPPKRDATDLQSAPFGHSGTPPFMELVNGRSRASRVSTACGTATAPFLSENLPPADFPNDKTLSGFESVSKLLDV